MKKYPIDNYYVGRINYSLQWTSLLMSRRLNKDFREKEKLVLDTIKYGAIDLRDKICSNTFDPVKRIICIPVFTIFYKGPDNKYYSLHNLLPYNKDSSDDLVEDLVPLSLCLPKIASSVDKEISFVKAREIFRELFCRKRKHLYTDQTFLLDDFYTGEATIYSSQVSKKGIIKDLNLAKSLILSSNGLNNFSGGTIIDKKQNAFNYITYPTVLLKVGKKTLYNTLDNQMYTEDGNSVDSSSCYVNKDVRMSLGLEIPQRVIYNNRISIPEVIKLTKRRKP